MNIIIFLIISLQSGVLGQGKNPNDNPPQADQISNQIQIPKSKYQTTNYGLQNTISEQLNSQKNGVRLISSSSAGCVFKVNKIGEQTSAEYPIQSLEGKNPNDNPPQADQISNYKLRVTKYNIRRYAICSCGSSADGKYYGRWRNIS